MAKLARKSWGFEAAVDEIIRACKEESETGQEQVACEILSNHQLTDGLLDKIITKIAQDFGFSRPTVKKWASARKESEQDDYEDKSPKKGELSASDKLWAEVFTGDGRKITYQEAVEVINRAATESDDEQVELIAKKIIANTMTNDGGYDLLVTRISKNLGLSRPLVKRWVRMERQRESAEEDESLSHAEIAEKYIEENLSTDCVGAEGDLWEYNKNEGIYEMLPGEDTIIKIGNDYKGSNCKVGGHYKNISEQIYLRKKDDKFFSDSKYGVATKSGFYLADMENKTIKILPNQKGNRVRWKLPYDPAPASDPIGPLWKGYLQHAFAGGLADPQVTLLQEVMGAILLGFFVNHQKAVLLYGRGGNGKSVVLDLLKSFFPANVLAAVRPEDFSDDNKAATLAGAVANFAGEIDSKKALPIDFKEFIGADSEVTIRAIYKAPFKLRCRCSHFLLGNGFPQTRDYSYGFFRRWLIFNFKNGTPEKEIERLGKKIANEEGPQMLRWMMDGAHRLLKNDGELTYSEEHEKALKKWKSSRDSVFGFFNDDESVSYADKESLVPHKDCYSEYKTWCTSEGFKFVKYRDFLDRARSIVQADYRPGPNDRRRYFRGISFLSAKNDSSQKTWY